MPKDEAMAAGILNHRISMKETIAQPPRVISHRARAAPHQSPERLSPSTQFPQGKSAQFSWFEFVESVSHNPSFLNRLFTSLKWKSSEQSFSSSPGLKCFATAGSAFRTSTK